jgi:iron complex outermembrane receptor protein
LAFDIERDENSPFYSQLINFNPLGYPVATVAEIAANGNRLPAGKIAPLPPIVTVTDERMKVADIGVPQQPSVDKTKGFMANLRWEPADDVELRSITAWRTVSAEQWDNSGGAHRTPTFLPNGNFSRYSLSFLNQRQFSQELQVVGSFPQVDYVLGLYYFNERAEEVASTPNTNRWNATGTNYTINDPAPWNPANWNISRATVAFAKSYAAYGQATWTPAGLDSLHITAGGRYTHDDKSGNLYRLNNAATNLPFEYEGGRFDPLAIVAWEASPAVNLYAKYSTGYRSGGASSRSPTFRSFGPETVTSYEIGAKTEPLDGVRFNIAGYVMNREDAQFDFDFYIPQPNGTIRHTLETVNAPDTVKIRGIEADLTVSPAPGLRFGVAYAYTDWSVPPSPNPLVPGSAPQPIFIVFTPPHAVSGAVDYELFLSGSSEMALKFHLDANYSDRHYSFDNEDVQVDDSFLVNARLTLADIPMSAAGQTLSISLWSRNLLNEAHIYRRSNANRVPIDGNIATVIGDYANFNTPRTFGAEVTISF